MRRFFYRALDQLGKTELMDSALKRPKPVSSSRAAATKLLGYVAAVFFLAETMLLFTTADVRLRSPITLLVRFQSDFIENVLLSGQLHGHRLALLNQTKPGMIEVNSEQLVTSLHNGQHFLSPEEEARIQFRAPVPGTVWDLVVLPDIVMLTPSAAIWMQTLVLSPVLLGLCIATGTPLWRVGNELSAKEVA